MGDFAAGLKSINDQFGVQLWGGDTVSIDGPAVFSATLIGECPKGMTVTRRGAKPDHDIWLTGFLGKGYFGLRAITESRENSDIFYRPPPRLELQSLLRTFASAAVDVSDGFIADLSHLLKASAIGGNVELERLKFPKDIQAWLVSEKGDLLTLLSHGDDYEVIFTSHADHRVAIEKAGKALPFQIHRVGTCGLGNDLTLSFNGKEVPIGKAGYSHF